MQHMEATTPSSVQKDPGWQAKTTHVSGFEVLFGKTAFSASAQVGSGELLPVEKPAVPVEKPALREGTPAQQKVAPHSAPRVEDNEDSRTEENLSPVEVLPKAEAPTRRAPSTTPITITAPPTLARICKNLGLTPTVAPPRRSLPKPPSSRLAPSELASESRQSWAFNGKTWKTSLSELDEGLGRWRDHRPFSRTEAGSLNKDFDDVDTNEKDTGTSVKAAEGKISAFCLRAPEAPTLEASAQVVTDSSFEGKSFIEDRMFAVSGIHLMGNRRAQEAYELLYDDPDAKTSSASPEHTDSLQAESAVNVESGLERNSAGSHARACSRGATPPLPRSALDLRTGLVEL